MPRLRKRSGPFYAFFVWNLPARIRATTDPARSSGAAVPVWNRRVRDSRRGPASAGMVEAIGLNKLDPATSRRRQNDTGHCLRPMSRVRKPGSQPHMAPVPVHNSALPEHSAEKYLGAKLRIGSTKLRRIVVSVKSRGCIAWHPGNGAFFGKVDTGFPWKMRQIKNLWSAFRFDLIGKRSSRSTRRRGVVRGLAKHGPGKQHETP